ncbi:hypothetical protein S83_051474, partial [Arachis hypogaea]
AQASPNLCSHQTRSIAEASRGAPSTQPTKQKLVWNGVDCWDLLTPETEKITLVFKNHYRWFITKFSMALDSVCDPLVATLLKDHFEFLYGAEKKIYNALQIELGCKPCRSEVFQSKRKDDRMKRVDKWSKDASIEFDASQGQENRATQIAQGPLSRRTLDIAKTVMKERSYVYNKKDKIIHLAKDGKLEEIMNAKSCSDLYSGFH